MWLTREIKTNFGNDDYDENSLSLSNQFAFDLAVRIKNSLVVNF